jgi:hypothetical protein
MTVTAEKFEEVPRLDIVTNTVVTARPPGGRPATGALEDCVRAPTGASIVAESS